MTDSRTAMKETCSQGYLFFSRPWLTVAQIGLTGQREFGSLWSIICTCVDYAFRPQRYLDESVMQWPRGKVLGGSRYVRSS